MSNIEKKLITIQIPADYYDVINTELSNIQSINDAITKIFTTNLEVNPFIFGGFSAELADNVYNLQKFMNDLVDLNSSNEIINTKEKFW